MIFFFFLSLLKIDDNKSKELVCVPLDLNYSIKCLNDSLEDSYYTSRALIHSRKLLSVYIFSRTDYKDYFGMPNNADFNDDSSSSSVERKQLARVNYFHSNPLDLTNKTFKNKSDVYISDPSVDLKVVIESYLKSIGRKQINKSSF